MNQVSEHFITIHNLIKSWINNQEFEKVSNFLDILTNAEMKTALVITKSFKSHPLLKESRQRLLHRFNSQYGKAKTCLKCNKITTHVEYSCLECQNKQNPDIISDIMKTIPLKSKIYISLQMDDCENWNNGEYLGDKKILVDKTQFILKEVFTWIDNGMPGGRDLDLTDRLHN